MFDEFDDDDNPNPPTSNKNIDRSKNRERKRDNKKLKKGLKKTNTQEENYLFPNGHSNQQKSPEPNSTKLIPYTNPTNNMDFTALPLKIKTLDGEENETELDVMELFKQIYAVDEFGEFLQKHKTATKQPQEDDYGVIEYKWKQVDKDSDRLDGLKTQMKFRIKEGSGEAYYNLGYMDNGSPKGLSQKDFMKSMETICYQSNALKADLILQDIKDGIEGKVAEQMVRNREREGFQQEVRVMVIGESFAGKTTQIGTLQTGKKDSGDGSIRDTQNKFEHELKSGRTSSLNYNVQGLDSAGNIKNHNMDIFGSTWEGIIEDSTKIQTFMEWGGYEKNKYSKAWIHNVLNANPDYCLQVINGQSGITEKTNEQFIIAMAQETPCFMVITHIDQISEDQQNNIHFDIRNMVVNMFKGQETKYPLRVKNKEDVIGWNISQKENLGFIPVFSISNTEWTNMDLFIQFLNQLPVSTGHHGTKDGKAEFIVQKKNCDTKDSMVISGIVVNGIIKKNQLQYFGPFYNGTFCQAKVTNIRCYLVDVKKAISGQTCSIRLKVHLFTSNHYSSTKT